MKQIENDTKKWNNIPWFWLRRNSIVKMCIILKEIYRLNTIPYQKLLLFSCSVLSNSLQSHGLQYSRLPCPSLSPKTSSNACPMSLWCHPAISSSVVPFSSYFLCFSTSGSFPKSQLFSLSGKSIVASASVLPMNIQG